MANAKGALEIAVLTVMASFVAVTAAAEPQILLHIDNRANVIGDELVAAKAVVEQTFKAAGVEIAWREGRFPASLLAGRGQTGPARHLAIILATGGRSDATAVCTLGFASPKMAVAYVYYDRILSVARKHPVDLGVLFGRVLAHEIGHLLLPGDSHSLYGIMRADLDVGFLNPNRFTKDQAQAILAAIKNQAAP